MRINCTFLALFMMSQVVTAQVISGHYYGTVNPITSEQFKISSSVSDYSFVGNKYYLGIDVPKNSKAAGEIPSKYLSADGHFYSEEGVFNLKINGTAVVIEFYSTSGYTYKEKLGTLFNDRRLFLYDGDTLFFEPYESFRWDGQMPVVKKISVSSFLKEKEVNYDGQSIITLTNSKLKPWVEGVEGYGIGEWIELTIESYQYPYTMFIVSNGYVSFTNPNLYYLNSRIKKIQIVSEQDKLDIIVELKDTPNLQVIKIPNPINRKESKVRFTILEVYKGSKWEDTCLNMIFPLGDQP